MNKFLKSMLVAGLFIYGTQAHAAELKIGYVQVDKILQEAPQTAETGKKLEREFSPRTAELDRLQKQIREIESQLDKNSLTISETERKNKERDVSNLKIDFQRKQREFREDLNQRRN